MAEGEPFMSEDNPEILWLTPEMKKEMLKEETEENNRKINRRRLILGGAAVSTVLLSGSLAWVYREKASEIFLNEVPVEDLLAHPDIYLGKRVILRNMQVTSVVEREILKPESKDLDSLEAPARTMAGAIRRVYDACALYKEGDRDIWLYAYHRRFDPDDSRFLEDLKVRAEKETVIWSYGTVYEDTDHRPVLLMDFIEPEHEEEATPTPKAKVPVSRDVL